MGEQTITLEIENGIATIFLDRPDRRNAFNRAMLAQLLAVFAEVDANDDVRVVIVTGKGDAFCVGADVSGGAQDFQVDDPAWRDGGGQFALEVFKCRKPVIAAINGAAAGIGATMTLPMDIRLAADEAKFGFVFSRRGLVPEACSSWFLPRVVGISQALEWVITGRVFGADEALCAGLVREVLPRDALLPRAREIASEIVRNCSGMSVAVARQMLWRMLGAAHPIEANRIESRAFADFVAAPDAAEGIAAFLEKRDPDFPMRVSADMPAYPWLGDPEFVPL